MHLINTATNVLKQTHLPQY